MTSDSNPVRFGSFELNLHSGELRKNGLRIRLAEQPLQILILLLEHPGDVVTREVLQRKLWSSDTFVEFEHSLNAAVKRLRDALGDSAENPRFIETLPRHGYRLITPIRSAEISSAEPIARKPTRAHRWKTSAVVVALLAVGTASYFFGQWWQRWQHSHTAIHSIAVLPVVNLSNDPGQERFCDSMTEALITELGRLRSLRVIPRRSSLHLKGTTRSIAQIGEELNADALVEASALFEVDKVRISAQLVRVKPEEQLWARSYERNFHDLIALQQEVSHEIVSEIQGMLSPLEEKTRLPKRVT